MKNLSLLLSVLLLWSAPLLPTVTYYASQLGCVSTLALTQRTIIILDQDITITDSCPFIFLPQPSFNDEPYIIFDAPTTAHSVIVATSTVWNLTQLTAHHTLQFKNKAQLINHAGAVLNLNGVTIRFSDTATWRVQP